MDNKKILALMSLKFTKIDVFGLGALTPIVASHFDPSLDHVLLFLEKLCVVILCYLPRPLEHNNIV